MPDEYFRPSDGAEPAFSAPAPPPASGQAGPGPSGFGGFPVWGPLAYAVVAAVLLGLCPGFPAVSDAVSEWIAIPIQLVALGLCATVAARRFGSSDLTRASWALASAFSALSLVATYVWNLWRPRGMGPVFSYADTL